MFIRDELARSAFALPPSPKRAAASRLRRDSLRSLRAIGSLGGLAEPKLAKRAKAGGARRDRTADLLHAMQALSQLSYGPLTEPAVWVTAGEHREPQFADDLKSLSRIVRCLRRRRRRR